MKRPSFKHAVIWIALNDEPGHLELNQISQIVTVQLVSDLFGVPVDKVAKDILKIRTKDLK